MCSRETERLLAVPGAKAGKEAVEASMAIPPPLASHFFLSFFGEGGRWRWGSLQNKLKRTLRKAAAQHKKREKGLLPFALFLFILFYRRIPLSVSVTVPENSALAPPPTFGKSSC